MAANRRGKTGGVERVRVRSIGFAGQSGHESIGLRVGSGLPVFFKKKKQINDNLFRKNE